MVMRVARCLGMLSKGFVGSRNGKYIQAASGEHTITHHASCLGPSNPPCASHISCRGCCKGDAQNGVCQGISVARSHSGERTLVS